MEKIKNESFFKQLNKMMGNPESVTITSIASIIKIMGIPPRIARAVGSLGPARPRGQVKTATTSFKWSGEPGRF